jgi:hypothetical protein
MPLLHSGEICTGDVGTPTLRDIAISLSRLPRFAGHTKVEWSVLDHSLFVFRLLAASNRRDYAAQLAGLLHDAHECVTGDIPSDMKPDVIREAQATLDVRIMDEHFPGGFVAYDKLKLLVHAADREALSAEAFLVGPPAVCGNLGATTEHFGKPSMLAVKLLREILGEEADTFPQDRFIWLVLSLRSVVNDTCWAAVLDYVPL